MLMALGRVVIMANGGWRGAAQAALGLYLVVRSPSHTHGKADWMPMAEVCKLFPAEPDPDIGGVVLGEAIRMDTTSVAEVRFDPRIPEGKPTWGPAGTGPLMFDHCRIGSTHGLVLVNSGGFKTTSLMMTLDYWKSGAFIFDPSEEIAAMTRQWRERMGHTVHVLDPEGRIGTNVVKWVTKCIEQGHPLAEVYLTVTVERCYGKTPPQPGQTNDNAAYFRDQGRNLFTALLAHVLWDSTLPADQKTLRQAKKLLALPEDDLRCVLRNIYETSESELARHLAAPLFDLTKVTFGGIHSNASQGTNWLGVKSFADMVSEDDFDLAELCNGRTTVYCQISMDALEAMPEVGRAIGSAAFNSVMQAKGKVKGRVWFWLDEADLWGPMAVLETARDRGRKYKITMCLCYQSEGLFRSVWDKRANAWFSGVAWVMYGVQADNDTAKSLSARLGTFGAKEYSESTNKGTSGKAMELGTRNRGSSSSTRDTKRDLMMPHELMQDMRTDERILLVLGEKPIRCTAAIAWRRPEVVDRIGKTDYQPNASSRTSSKAGIPTIH
jgi:type IV secretion system protein VirD4